MKRKVIELFGPYMSKSHVLRKIISTNVCKLYLVYAIHISLAAAFSFLSFSSSSMTLPKPSFFSLLTSLS